MSADGLSSVEDLKIVLTAETQKFADGIEASREMIQKFVGDGTGQLGKLDGMLAKLGDTAGKLPGVFGVIATQIAALQAAWSTARDVAEKIGLKDDIEDVESAFSQFWTTFQIAGASALERAGADVSNYKQELVKLQAQQEENAKSASKAMTPIGQAISDVVRDVDANIARRFSGLENVTNAQLTRLRDNAREHVRLAEESGVASAENVSTFWRIVGGSIEKVSALLEEYRKEAQLLEGEYNKRLIDSFPKALPEEMFFDLEKRTEALRKQNFELEIQVATFGKSAAAAAKLAENMRMLAESEGKVFFKPDQQEEYDKENKRRDALKKSLEDMAEAKKRAAEQEREQNRQSKIVESIDSNIDAEIAELRVKISTHGQSAEAMAEELFVEKQLALARRQGLEITDADIAGIRARAEEYGALNRVLRQMQDQMALVKDVNSAISNDILGEFMSWTRGAEFSVNRMTANILSDLARIAMQRYVLQTLFGGGAGGGGGIFSAAFSGLFGGLFGGGGGMAVEHVGAGYVNSLPFGGPRADGGPVSAGNAYLVGERGPEIFVPPGSGSIIPNFALPQAGGQQAGGEIIVRVVASDEFEAKIDSRAQGVVAKAAPDIVGASVKETQKALPGMMKTASARSM